MDKSENPYDEFMNGEAPDPFNEYLARLEQVETHVPNIAKLVTLYYTSLIKEGMPYAQAFVLARDYSSLLLTS